MDVPLREQIQKAIADNEVLLFMKGSRDIPACGFSGRTAEILDAMLGNYSTVDVLTHEEIREAIKEISSWPTFPQLYVRGEFVGGADIIEEMFNGGTLHELLGVAPLSAAPPTITITDRAAEALRGFISNPEEMVLLLIDREFSPQLSVGPEPENVFVCESNGLKVAIDRVSATRAEGLKVDYIDTPNGQAFRVDNPNEPAKVKQLSPTQLKAWMDEGIAVRLIDVRTPAEWEKAHIEGAELLDADLMRELQEQPVDTVMVFQCHHGHRSQRVAEQMIPLGFKEIHNLVGGIDAWSSDIDSAVPKY